MGDVQGSSVQGVNYPRRKLSGCNYLGAIFLCENCSGGNCLGAVCQGGNCLGGQLSRGELSRSHLKHIFERKYTEKDNKQLQVFLQDHLALQKQALSQFYVLFCLKHNKIMFCTFECLLKFFFEMLF